MSQFHDGTSAAIHPKNYILANLPPEQMMALARHLTPVDLPLGTTILKPNQPIDNVYFIETGMVSTEAQTEEGESVEVGVIGQEGIVGFQALLGQPNMPHVVVVQGTVSALRIRASILRLEFLKGGRLTEMLYDFMYLQFVQISQSVLCNRMHDVEARLARWLLSASDRSHSEALQLTQEFLAQMLGSRRSTVTIAAGVLQRSGLIEYSRGKLKILDRARLEEAACECYSIVRDAYERILQDNDHRQQ